MNKNIPHPAGVFKYDLGSTPEAWEALGAAACEHRRALTEALAADNVPASSQASILRAVIVCAKLERLAVQAAEGGNA